MGMPQSFQLRVLAARPLPRPWRKRLNAVCPKWIVLPGRDYAQPPSRANEGLLVNHRHQGMPPNRSARKNASRRIKPSNWKRRVAERTPWTLPARMTRLRQFAWAASHDPPGNPSHGASSYSQWIAKTYVPPGSRAPKPRCSQFVQDSATRMGGLLAALRQYIYISESGEPGDRPRSIAMRFFTRALSNLEGTNRGGGSVCGMRSVTLL